MLPQQNRLRCRHDFAKVYNQGNRYGGRFLRLRVRFTDNPHQPTRIGIVISKKVSKQAVVRNRVKRQLRAILRSHLSNLRQGLQIIVTVSTLRGEPTYHQLCQDLNQILIKAEILY
ncbi:ribonuclease P protein component [Thalassoporum mexicanum PCC 7367]|uniref:ribonuclease P protein component n=1 Tax=Thalassoporum mexicanum TaxID=3457544 RepID=UPI00029FA368|nr:ribonuclease P protein component [Pseudanabaena sp. PCC 7367]AFY71676.1 ribonuclease P protein component [Pseudanabaena sp. PCC 7367]